RLPVLPDNLKRLYKKLVEMEIQENLSKTIVQTILAKLNEEEITNKEILGTFLKKIFSSMVKIAVPIEKMKSRKQQVIALVGPTGVGKTTTVAKIAANCKIFHGKKVGIITADTFRIAAVEQIQTFANIAGLPIEVVYEASEMKDALRELRDMDIVLIDTVGRSQKKSEQLLKIKEFIDSANAQQVHLVMSLTGSTKNLLDVAQQFSILKPNRYIFSKLDEVSGAGNLLNIIYKMKMPVSYVTTGQNVPDDILMPDANTLSRLLLYGLN
ncbi:MAG: AAA family ATPase, partial [Calditrichia bacterium]|nr:AAA family ATPase [Calditrichia bacterium]